MKKYQVATSLLWLSFATNAFCDRLIFSEAYKSDQVNFWWHVLKWFVDRPALFLAGLLFYSTVETYFKLLKKNFYWWAWHYPTGIKYLTGAIVGGFLLWQSLYYLLSCYF